MDSPIWVRRQGHFACLLRRTRPTRWPAIGDDSRRGHTPEPATGEGHCWASSTDLPKSPGNWCRPRRVDRPRRPGVSSGLLESFERHVGLSRSGCRCGDFRSSRPTPQHSKHGYPELRFQRGGPTRRSTSVKSFVSSRRRRQQRPTQEEERYQPTDNPAPSASCLGFFEQRQNFKLGLFGWL